MASRSPTLLRLLLSALPFAAAGGVAGGVAVVPIATLSGCACGDLTTVFPISQQDYDRLLKRYGSDGIPAGECQLICISPPSVGADSGADAGADGGADGGADAGPSASVDRVMTVHECSLTTIEFGTPAALCTGTPDCGGAGRRPPGLLPADRLKPSTPPLGAHFAQAARLEAASVPAFFDLALELAAHGAPRELVRATEHAAAEEIRHAHLMGILARAHGAAPLAARVARRRYRDLEAMALENAIEGCVLESFGAAVLRHQARNARDPLLRAVLTSISADEASHAELSRGIHAWALSRLGARAARRLAVAREEASSTLAAAHEAEPAREVAGELGLPSAEQAQTIIAALDA